MGYINERIIKELVEEKIADSDLFIGEIKVKPGNIIYVFLDGDSGVTVDSCIAVSRHIESHLDRDREDFELHVSSFGVGQALKLHRQYRNAIGRQFSIDTLDGEKHEGKLLQVFENKIVIEKQGTKKKDPSVEAEFLFSDIKTAKIKVVF
ncbi:MAG: ribosome assembly cofactor RimP [Lentimicrobiaceae bacterium]|nr:ribosome assembly cofactor RimP [Lentimicrobiaceae bacterium]